MLSRTSGTSRQSRLSSKYSQHTAQHKGEGTQETSYSHGRALENDKPHRGDPEGGSSHPWQQPARLNPDDDDNDDHFGFHRATLGGVRAHMGETRRGDRDFGCKEQGEEARVVPSSIGGKAWSRASVAPSTIAMWKVAIQQTCSQGRSRPIGKASSWDCTCEVSGWHRPGCACEGKDPWTTGTLVVCG